MSPDPAPVAKNARGRATKSGAKPPPPTFLPIWLTRGSLSREAAVLLLIGAILAGIAVVLFITQVQWGQSRLRLWSLFAMDATIACVGGGLSAFATEDVVVAVAVRPSGGSGYVSVPAAEWRELSEEIVRARKTAPRTVLPPFEMPLAASVAPLSGPARSSRPSASIDYHEEDAAAEPGPKELVDHSVAEPVPVAPSAEEYDESGLADSLEPSAPTPETLVPRPEAPDPSPELYDEELVEPPEKSQDPSEDGPLPQEVKNLLSEWYGRDTRITFGPSPTVAAPAPETPPGSGIQCVTCDRMVARPPDGYVCKNCGESICDVCWVKTRADGHPEVCGLCRILGREPNPGSPKPGMGPGAKRIGRAKPG
jgi:hypothetical protein